VGSVFLRELCRRQPLARLVLLRLGVARKVQSCYTSAWSGRHSAPLPLAALKTVDRCFKFTQVHVIMTVKAVSNHKQVQNHGGEVC